MADAFATPAELNTFSGRTIPTAQATMMLAQASALIRSYCGWHLYPSAGETLTLDGSGARVLDLPTLCLTAVASVTEDGELLVEESDYQWSRLGLLIRVSAYWSADFRGVVAVITHGYSELPAEVQAVCLQVAARAVASPSGVKSEQSGGLSVTYSVPGGLSELEQMVLERHRVPQRA